MSRDAFGGTASSQKRITFGQSNIDALLSQRGNENARPQGSGGVGQARTMAQAGRTSDQPYKDDFPLLQTGTQLSGKAASPSLSGTTMHGMTRSSSVAEGKRSTSKTRDPSQELDRLLKIEAGWTEVYGGEVISENQKLKKKIQILEREIQRLKSSSSPHVSGSEEIHKYMLTIRELESKNTELTMRLSRETQKFSQEYVQEKAKEFFQLREQLVGENRRLKTQVTSLKQESESLKAQVISLNSRVSEGNSWLTQMEALHKENSRLRLFPTPQEAVSETVSFELGREKQKSVELEQEVQSLRAQVASFRCEDSASAVRNCPFHSHKGDVAVGNRMVDLYKRKLDENLATILSLTEQLEGMKQRCLSLESQLAESRRTAMEDGDGDSIRVNQLLAQIATLNSRIQSLEAEKIFWLPQETANRHSETSRGPLGPLGSIGSTRPQGATGTTQSFARSAFANVNVNSAIKETDTSQKRPVGSTPFHLPTAQDLHTLALRPENSFDTYHGPFCK